jgi:endonuclease/exonuclease/phosphatase family metal-dependent hydrolase
MILSRVPFQSLFIRDFPTRLGRKAVFGTVKVKGSARPLLFGTFHLESYPEDRPIRQLQMEMYLNVIASSNAGHVMLCGDSNFASDSEASVYASGGLLDTWHHLYQRTPEDEARNPGVTFDTELNPMTTAGKTAPSIHARTRLDRLFFSPNSVNPTSMEVIGTEPIDRSRGLWPSDHYGIHVKLALLPSTQYVNNLCLPLQRYSTSLFAGMRFSSLVW